MSKLEEIKNNQRIKQYFRDNLKFEDDEEFERRFQIYLEVFPFIALDFRLKADCHEIHKSASIVTGLPGAPSRLTSTTELEATYPPKAETYRKILEDVRNNLNQSEIEINLDEF